jgi:DNA-directed RNA polymerase sigma subunit (sigma70/sigma32)
MSDEEPLKSAYELAMDRLKTKDKEEGVKEAEPLSRKQKEEITRLRQEALAKLAELEILHRKNLSGAGGDPEKTAEVERNYKVDRERVDSRLESAIAKVREGKKG